MWHFYRVPLRDKKFSWKDVKRQQNQDRKSQSGVKGQIPGTVSQGNQPAPEHAPSQASKAKPAWYS